MYMESNYKLKETIYASSLGSYPNDFYELNYTFQGNDSPFNELICLNDQLPFILPNKSEKTAPSVHHTSQLVAFSSF